MDRREAACRIAYEFRAAMKQEGKDLGWLRDVAYRAADAIGYGRPSWQNEVWRAYD